VRPDRGLESSRQAVGRREPAATSDDGDQCRVGLLLRRGTEQAPASVGAGGDLSGAALPEPGGPGAVLDGKQLVLADSQFPAATPGTTQRRVAGADLRATHGTAMT